MFDRRWPRFPALLCGTAALLAGACNDTLRPRLGPTADLAIGRGSPASGKNPARDTLQAWLVALNAADPGQIRRVNEGATPGAPLLTSRTLSLAGSTGGFDLKSCVVFESTPTTRVVKLQSRRTSAWYCLAFGVEPEPPHAIGFMFVSPTAAPLAPAGTQSPVGTSLEPVGTLLDTTARQTILRAIVSALNEGYVYPEKVAAVDSSLGAQQARHAYDAIQSRTTFAQVLTHDIFQVLHDRHVMVGVGCSVSADPARTEPPPAPAAPLDPAFYPRVFGETRRLAGDVAYVDVRSFGAPAELARAEIHEVMSAIADAHALIIDIRSNPGGNPETLALLSSYLFDDERVHLNSLVGRDATTAEDFFTDPRVEGPRFGSKKPVYVLAGGGTFSAAEEFAYDLQSLKRAQIVGEATGGGAHPGGSVPLPYGLSLRVPSLRAVNPVTKTNWERTGVRPDIPVAADQALEAAHKLALEVVSVRSIAADAPTHTDQERIQGTWLAQTESQNGQKRNVDYRYVFRGDHITFTDESGKEMKYSFTLDTASRPKLIIIRPEDSQADSAPVGVAYELKGDSLTLVVAPSGARPTGISDENNQELIACERKRP